MNWRALQVRVCDAYIIPVLGSATAGLGMFNPLDAADVVDEVVVVVERKRRHVEAPDLELTQDNLRLRIQIRSVVDEVLFGQPVHYDCGPTVPAGSGRAEWPTV